MRLMPSQIERILQQISKNILVYIGVNLGEAVLSEVDLALLTGLGLNPVGLGGAFPAYYRMYLLGRLTQLIGDANSKEVDYSNFERYLLKNQYQPLTPFEEMQYALARQATYHHLKNLEHRVRVDAENGILDELSRSQYEDIIKEEITSGVKERKSVTNIISDIGHKTGDWSKDLGRIVDTEMNNIFQRGRAVQIAKENPGKDPLVYKDTFEGACRHCIALYLTKGLGSEPRVFKLSQLIANGSNIGRKVKDWLPTLSGVHPFCRCSLRHKQDYMIWDKAKKQYVYDDEALAREEKRLGIKGTVTIQVGDKVFTA
jgi:hypothetical protein